MCSSWPGPQRSNPTCYRVRHLDGRGGGAPRRARVAGRHGRRAKGRSNCPVLQSFGRRLGAASVETQDHLHNKSREKKPPWFAFQGKRSLGRGPGDIAGGGSVSEGAKVGAEPCSSTQCSVRKEAGSRTFEERCLLSETSQNSRGTNTTTARPLALHVSSDDPDVRAAVSSRDCVWPEEPAPPPCAAPHDQPASGRCRHGRSPGSTHVSAPARV